MRHVCHIIMVAIMGTKPYVLRYLRRSQRSNFAQWQTSVRRLYARKDSLGKLISALFCFEAGDMGILGRGEEKLDSCKTCFYMDDVDFFHVSNSFG